MDHLPQLCASAFPDSKIAKGLACARTKTTAVINNIIGDENFRGICENLRTKKFSIIIDESTDISTQKHLCIVVRYVVEDSVKDNFFKLIKVEDAKALSIYNLLIENFTKYEIPYKENLIGFASDGANVMFGAHQSVMKLLKNDIPGLFVMKCICHSFHLCASNACHKLPMHLEDLARDIHNYFNSSPKRKFEYIEFQNFCNVKIHNLLHPSQTRWLSLESVVKRILEQYEPLKLYFIDIVSSKNDVLLAENILQKLQDIQNKLYFQFLEYVLPFFNQLNREMQSESPKIHNLFEKVTTVLRTIFDCFLKRDYIVTTPIANIDFKNPRNFLPLENMYFGANVVATLSKSQNILPLQIENFKLRCLDFYIEACSQITSRFPLSNNILQKLSFIDPEKVKQGHIQSIVDIALSFPHLIKENELRNLDYEWRLLRNSKEMLSFSNNVESFWQSVKKITLGDGALAYETLCNFVENLLSLPHSSANCERVFSTCNLLKTKQRNRLETTTISGLLYTKQYIQKGVCHNFPVEKSLISKMTDANLKGKSSYEN